MQIVNELKSKIPTKDERYQTSGILDIKNYYDEQIKGYENVIFPRNILLSKDDSKYFEQVTIPMIKNLHSKTYKVIKQIECILDTWYDIENKEKKRFIKILSALQTMEDVSEELNNIIDQVSQKMIISNNKIQLLAQEFIRIQAIFELNDVIINKGNEILDYLDQLYSIAKSTKDDEISNNIDNKVEQIDLLLCTLDLFDIRANISRVEKAFLEKYQDSKTIRLVLPM